MVEMGEYVVGAYLRTVESCDAIMYNTKTLGGDIDVMGLKLKDDRVFVSQVATHLGGLNYGEGKDVAKITDQMRRARKYAEEAFPKMNVIYQFWSVITGPSLTVAVQELARSEGFEFITNHEYTTKVGALAARAATQTTDIGEPFYRALQILTHLKKTDKDAIIVG